MNYVKPEDIKAYVEQHPQGVAGMSEELATMVNHFVNAAVYECADVVTETRWHLPPTQQQIAIGIKEHFGVGMSTEDKKTLIKELLGVK